MYGFVAEGEPVQLVTFRVEAAGMVRKAELQAHPDAGPDASGAIVDRRPVWLPEARRLRVHARSTTATGCGPGNRIAGPAIVEQMDATTLVPARHDRAGRRRISTCILGGDGHERTCIRLLTPSQSTRSPSR